MTSATRLTEGHLLLQLVKYNPQLPVHVTPEKLKKQAQQIAAYAKLNNTFFSFTSLCLRQLKSMHELANKYSVYNREYADPTDGNRFSIPKQYNVAENPHLLDLVSTGYFDWGNVLRSQEQYTPVVRADMCRIVSLTPKSINCRLGHLMCREGVTPLVVACHNLAIPLEDIEFLLNNGANPNVLYRSGGKTISLLRDLEKQTPSPKTAVRHSAVIMLLRQHGAFSIGDPVRANEPHLARICVNSDFPLEEITRMVQNKKDLLKDLNTLYDRDGKKVSLLRDLEEQMVISDTGEKQRYSAIMAYLKDLGAESICEVNGLTDKTQRLRTQYP